MLPAIIVSIVHSFAGSIGLPKGVTDSRWVIDASSAAISADGKTSAVMIAQRGECWSWQTWVIHPGIDGRYQAYRLPGEPEIGGNYGSTLHISSRGKYLFQDQKTGSGNNFAVVYSLKDARYLIDTAQNRQMPAAPMSELLRSFFGESTGLGDPFDHYWVSWQAWDKDGVSVEVAISASHCDGDFHVSGWRARFNVQTGRFYLTRAEAAFNRKTIVFNKRIPKDERVFRSAVSLPEKPAK